MTAEETIASLEAQLKQALERIDEVTEQLRVAQARLQCLTRDDRKTNPDAKPHYEVLAHKGPNGEPMGLATLPPSDPADVFFDMEGYPLVIGGLEYLFGT